MQLHRRAFLASAAMGALATTAGLLAQPKETGVAPRPDPAPAPPERFLTWSPAAGRGWVATGYGGNSLVIPGDAAVLLIDCKNSPFGAVLRREAEEVCGRAVTHVLNTHHHADHTGGNHAMNGLPVLAHRAAGPRIATQVNRYISQIKEAIGQLAERKGPATAGVLRDVTALHDRVARLAPADFAPTRLLDGPEVLDLGGTSVSVRHFGPGHTDNDVVVKVEGLNIVHTGDLVFNGRHPFVDQGGGGNTVGWQESLRRTLELCDDKTVVVPGHGDVTDRAAITRQIEYFDRARDAVAAAMKAGKARKEIVEMRIPGCEDYTGSASMTLGAMFVELGEHP